MTPAAEPSRTLRHWYINLIGAIWIIPYRINQPLKRSQRLLPAALELVGNSIKNKKVSIEISQLSPEGTARARTRARPSEPPVRRARGPAPTPTRSVHPSGSTVALFSGLPPLGPLRASRRHPTTARRRARRKDGHPEGQAR